MENNKDNFGYYVILLLFVMCLGSTVYSYAIGYL